MWFESVTKARDGCRNIIARQKEEMKNLRAQERNRIAELTQAREETAQLRIQLAAQEEESNRMREQIALMMAKPECAVCLNDFFHNIGGFQCPTCRRPHTDTPCRAVMR
uniref:RING-type domain-containing protein n=1 Tax=Caenorhabditis tropicalis TaxID=1561998 RepID=A0A1I7U1R5_9PELO